MAMSDRKRFITELVATAIASSLLIVLLALLHQQTIFWWLAFPFVSLTGRIGAWINSVFPPQGGGWFEGLGTILVAEAIPAVILIWVILFTIVRLIERLIKMRRERHEV
jgi:hypothetical protein